MSADLSSVKTDPPSTTDRRHRRLRWLVAAILVASMLVTTAYTVTSAYIATQLVQRAQLPYHTTPADFHLSFRDVSFTSREDHLLLRGWFLPGILSDGSMTTQHTIIGTWLPRKPSNRKCWYACYCARVCPSWLRRTHL